jgi:Ca2+-binding EF-hand superfamily protein
MAASNYDAQASTNYKEAFALFDKRGNQRVQLESLGDLLRACGQNPTLAEIRDLEKSVMGSDCKIMSLPLSIPIAPPFPDIHIYNPSQHPQP